MCVADLAEPRTQCIGALCELEGLRPAAARLVGGLWWAVVSVDDPVLELAEAQPYEQVLALDVVQAAYSVRSTSLSRMRATCSGVTPASSTYCSAEP